MEWDGRENDQQGWERPVHAVSSQKASVLREVEEPVGVVSTKLSRKLPTEGAVSRPPAWIKKFKPNVTQNSMTIRRFLIVDYSDCKYLGKESNSKRCVPISTLAGSRTK
ncbi:hypothetical protein AVEN_185635-1 [Araneus ventricosus]|uniref:Uncharacterized protein n=1 Tax=Araneus ventricosus TaxID=182803 RepID=A0A4Y2AJN2_ARAVE|nr:hypothetical protein AVEN_185635-1 [Araneus ventricosus]